MVAYFRIDDIERIQLLTDVVHKIKNALGGIGGFAALIERDLAPEDPRKRLAERIQTGVLRMNDHVVNLMALVQVPEMEPEPVDPLPVVREIWEQYRQEQNQYGGNSDCPLEPTVLVRRLSVDPGLFRNTLLHLFRFSHLIGGRIERIRCTPGPDGTLRLEVVFPRGPGFRPTPEADVQRLSACESIEARLSLTLAIRLAEFTRATVALDAPDDSRWTLVVQYS